MPQYTVMVSRPGETDGIVLMQGDDQARASDLVYALTAAASGAPLEISIVIQPAAAPPPPPPPPNPDAPPPAAGVRRPEGSTQQGRASR